jgi:hypothetical protein
MMNQNVRWTNHGYKHVPQKNLTWKHIVESTQHGGAARYKTGINIKNYETQVWKEGLLATNG